MITEPALPDSGGVFLDLKLLPNQSASPRVLGVIMKIMLSAYAVMGLYFISLGAWPVFGLLGLDILLLYLAFRYAFRNNRAYEHVLVDRAGMTIAHVDARGCSQMQSIEPTFLQVRLEEEQGQKPLRLYSKGKYVEIGRYLGLPEKEWLAGRIREALKARQNALISS